MGYSRALLGTPGATGRFCRLQLDEEAAPLACENFLHLCRGDKGKSKEANVPLTYKGSKLHRLLPGFIIQGPSLCRSNMHSITAGLTVAPYRWGLRVRERIGR
jgi:cyclophilin family peptidyl-prolyl cis-trans isomerase